MDTPKIFESEYRFCLILWEHEPVKSSELVKLCREQLGWKPTTTYTVLRRLSDRGVLKNENTVVTSLVSKDECRRQKLTNWWRKNLKVLCRRFLLRSQSGGKFHRRRSMKSRK